MRAPDPDHAAVTQAAGLDISASRKTAGLAKLETGSLRMQHDMGIVDDGISRLTTMLRQKERQLVPHIGVMGKSIDSPRHKHGYLARSRAMLSDSGVLDPEQTLGT